MIAVLFIGGVQLICLGIMGEYLRRIYDETKDRPNFVIETILNHNKFKGRLDSNE